MSFRGKLLAVSGAHFAVTLLGMKLALARRLPFHNPLFHGDPRRVGRDSFLMGTALSEPVTMMFAEVAAMVRLTRGESPGAATTLGLLGAANVGGYLVEQHVRERLTLSGWDAVETPLVVAGIGTAAMMAIFVRTERSQG